MADLQKYKPLLHDNPLCGIDTYKDTLNLATGACTRQIYKFVLTGDETWSMGGGATPYPYIAKSNMPYPHASDSALLCTHFLNGNNGITNGTSYALLTGGYTATGATDLSTWKVWLAQQYANGTPVIVWYVLETAETETITVPSGLSGTEEGYLIQDSTPTPTNPIYPTANEVLIWQHSLRKLATATDTFTTLPVDVYADGNNATVSISGNTVQPGTPTRENPIMPQGTGERTGNYLPTPVSATVESSGITIESSGDGIINVSGTRTSGDSPIINLKESVTFNGTYYVHLRNNAVAPSSVIVLRNGTTSIVNITLTSTNLITQIALSNVTIDNIQVYVTSGTSINTQMAISIEQTDSVTEYEPFGVKIPISSASTTTPVYLGEVETTRKIKKLVLTGEEDWTLRSGEPSNVYFVEFYSTNFIMNKALCTHYINQDSGSFGNLEDKHCLVTLSSDNIRSFIGLRDSDYPSTNAGANQLKQWLAQQYAAGTPVTIWYVLATPETGVVNEPLMKIGEYADEVSGVTIPTIAGGDTISVDTTVQPSEVSLSYTGWHDATVKEYDGSDWQ